jgi:PII-like signaling protein
MRANTPSQFPSRPAKRATMLFSMRDHAHHRSLMIQLLKRARRAKLSGATVYEAHAGYGESGRVHRVHLMADDRPVTLVIVDRPETIVTFLDQVADLLHDVLVTVDDIDIVEF